MDWIYSYVRYLRVDPYGDYRNRDYVSIYLCLDDNSNMPPIESAIMAEFTISILNQKNGKHSQQKGSSYQLLQFSIALEFDAFRNRVYIYNPFVFCGELPSCISILLSPSLICFCFLFFFLANHSPHRVFLERNCLGMAQIHSERSDEEHKCRICCWIELDSSSRSHCHRFIQPCMMVNWRIWKKIVTYPYVSLSS